MSQEIDLGQVEHLGVFDCPSGLVHQIASSANLVGLEGQEASILHADIGHSLRVLACQRTIECLEEKLLHAFVGAQSTLKGNESKNGLDVSRCHMVRQGLVKLASFRHLLLLLLENCLLYHELHKIANVLRANASSSTFKLGSDQTWILQRLLDEVDVLQPELKVQIKRD